MTIYLPALRRCSLFHNMADETILKLCQCLGGTIRQYPRGTILLLAGQPVNSAGIVLTGQLHAEQQTLDGEHIIVANHTAGSLFGDILMSGSRLSPVTLTATTNLTVLYFAMETILGDCGQHCQCHLQLRQNLLVGISEKFWAQQKKIGYLSMPSLRRKLLSYLLDQRTTDSDLDIFLPYNREELASYLGVNRSALSRELGRLQKEGILTFHKRQITILDLSRLLTQLSR